MQATAMDSLSDTIATSVVLAAMIIMRLTSINVDGFGGLLVAIFILYAGIKAVKDTMDPLLGKAPTRHLSGKSVPLSCPIPKYTVSMI